MARDMISWGAGTARMVLDPSNGHLFLISQICALRVSCDGGHDRRDKAGLRHHSSLCYYKADSSSQECDADNQTRH